MLREFSYPAMTHSAQPTLFDTLIAVDALAALQRSPKPALLVDCSFDLAKPEAGRRVYLQGHLPGARHLDLEGDLSAPKTGRNGRHPLPDRAEFTARMQALGLNDDTQVVVYDNAGGMYAARLWWMLRWIGHRPVALLDGGAPAWAAAGHALQTTLPPAPHPGRAGERPSCATLVRYDEVLAHLSHAQRLVIDARAPDRFRGENETLDPVGGRIPGAVNRFFRDNLGADGRFKPAIELRQAFEAVMGGQAAEQTIVHCGSGVTGCHNLLAMEVAGLRGAALYAGSWSEWCAQPGAPVATGPV